MVRTKKSGRIWSAALGVFLTVSAATVAVWPQDSREPAAITLWPFRLSRKILTFVSYRGIKSRFKIPACG